jgi:hypothetical protein
MLSFGKNRDDKGVKKHRYRYDLHSIAEEEIADVLLTDENQAPLAAALVEQNVATDKGEEVIYELVVEEKTTSPSKPQVHETIEKKTVDAVVQVAITTEVEKTEEPLESEKHPDLKMSESLHEQVAKLCHEYEAIHQQLETSLAASNELTKQLAASRKQTTLNYLILGVAGFALLLAIVSTVVTMSIQRDVNDLKDSFAALANQTVATKKETALKVKELEERVGQLNTKMDEFFTADNLDNVLQVTKELKKQIHALTSKSTAVSNLHAQLDGEKEKSDLLSASEVKPAVTVDKKVFHKSISPNKDDKLPQVNKTKKVVALTASAKTKQKKLAKHSEAANKTLKDKPEDKNHASHVDKKH